MTACVFLGPTMPLNLARRTLSANYLPPVRQGDIYRAIRRFRPRMIGIVDGYFHQVLSVWHKEIFFAMSEGIHVLGNASMGALHAAELHAFGMEGVGQVFEAFRDGTLEDDDEVAVVHAPEEIGFVAASEAMVNIRRTLEAASTSSIITATTAQALEAVAKTLFYPLRAYPEILKQGKAAGLPLNELDAFEAWLETGRIDVKRNDAQDMLKRMNEMIAGNLEPKSIHDAFEHTTMWEAATSALDRTDVDGESVSDMPMDVWLMDEIRLDDAKNRPGDTALLRLLALDEVDRQGLSIDEEERREAFNAFRLERGLHRGDELRAWLAARDLDRKDVLRLIEDDLLLGKVAEHLHAGISRFAIDALRLGNDYERLFARAKAKRRTLEATGEDQELTDDPVAVTCFFEEKVGAPPPEDIDAYARQRGFRDGADFSRAVMQDYRYRRICKKAPFDDA